MEKKHQLESHRHHGKIRTRSVQMRIQIIIYNIVDKMSLNWHTVLVPLDIVMSQQIAKTNNIKWQKTKRESNANKHISEGNSKQINVFIYLTEKYFGSPLFFGICMAFFSIEPHIKLPKQHGNYFVLELLLVNRQSSYLILVCLHSDHSSASFSALLFAWLLYAVDVSISFNVNAIILFHSQPPPSTTTKSLRCRAIQFMSLVDCFHNRNQTLNRISMFWSKRKTLYKCTKVVVQKSTYHFFVFACFYFRYFVTNFHLYFSLSIWAVHINLYGTLEREKWCVATAVSEWWGHTNKILSNWFRNFLLTSLKI